MTVVTNIPTRYWRWTSGRQKGTQYRKFPLYCFKIGNYAIDAFILHYEKPTLLGWHRDQVEEYKHWRMNIKLWGKATFSMEKNGLITTDKAINFFRSDLIPHSLDVKSQTVKLSLGFFKKLTNDKH